MAAPYASVITPGGENRFRVLEEKSHKYNDYLNLL
jgi:hypothetical protein